MKSAMIWYKQAAQGGTGYALDKVLRYNEDDCKAMIVVKEGFEKMERSS
jgi:predicted RecB family nuclease